jgi:Na+/H+ antiporter NhaA
VRLGTHAAENDLRGWLNNGLMTSFFLVCLRRGTSSTRRAA